MTLPNIIYVEKKGTPPTMKMRETHSTYSTEDYTE